MDCEKYIGRGQQVERIIPRLPDDISLEHIATKMSWITLRVLRFVSQAWRTAIEEQEVYKVRKRTNSRQTLIVFTFIRCPKPNRLEQTWRLYNLDQKWKVRLPPLLPITDPGIVLKHVARTLMLDGKLYVLEQYTHSQGIRTSTTRGRPRGKRRTRAHVVDLGACQLSWKTCAAMKIKNCDVCVACNGKLYVFQITKRVFRGEIFDPKKGRWSLVVDKAQVSCPTYKYNGTVAILNNEIYFSSCGMEQFGRYVIIVFNCSTKKWRVMENTATMGEHVQRSWVVIDGTLYSLSSSGVEVYDPSSNMWAVVQPVLFDGFFGYGGTIFGPMTPIIATATPSGKEVLVLMTLRDPHWPSAVAGRKQFCRSVGFGVQGQTLVWEAVPWDDLQAALDDDYSYFLGSVQL